MGSDKQDRTASLLPPTLSAAGFASSLSDELGSVLGAILLNPPSGRGERTLRHLAVARQLLKFDRLEIANIFPIPTPAIEGLNLLGVDRDPWLSARNAIFETIQHSDAILLGWGIGGTNGDARRNMIEQQQWVLAELSESKLDSVWLIDGQPRHPSRWHQYVSDRRGRTTGGSFSQRLIQVLQLVPLDQIEVHGRDVGSRSSVLSG